MKDGFILPFWNRLFGILEKLSLFALLRKLFPKLSTYGFVEVWVILNLFLAITTSITMYYFHWTVLAYILIFYGLARTFEVIIYQINMLFFHPYRSELRGEQYFVKSPIRTLILLVHNYFELIFWFAGIFISLSHINKMYSANGTLLTYWNYFEQSITCFFKFDSASSMFTQLANFEITAGFIMTTITFARFLGALPALLQESDIKK